MKIQIDPQNKPGGLKVASLPAGEVVMSLWLEETGSSSVSLFGKDNNGQEWRIAKIGPEGMSLFHSIHPSSGWPLMKRGYLRLRGKE